jgi:hypothetical protein
VNYVISSDQTEGQNLTARVAGDALILAEDLAAQGWTNVRITTPEGETLALRQFAALLRLEGPAVA